MPLIVADYSQLELRMSAQVWPDPLYIRALNDKDVHGATMRRIEPLLWHLNLPKEELRNAAKGVNFGIVYRSKGRRIHEQTGLPLEVVETILNEMKLTYPDLFSMIEETEREVLRTGRLRSITGRKRRYFFTGDKRKDAALLRQAVNWCVQGPAAEMTYLAHAELEHFLRTMDYPAYQCSNVHDAIHVDCPKHLVQPVGLGIKRVMEGLPTEREFGWTLNVPLKVEIKVGPNWGALETLHLEAV